jgi:hypothetical protein
VFEAASVSRAGLLRGEVFEEDCAGGLYVFIDGVCLPAARVDGGEAVSADDSALDDPGTHGANLFNATQDHRIDRRARCDRDMEGSFLKGLQTAAPRARPFRGHHQAESLVGESLSCSLEALDRALCISPVDLDHP